MERTPALVLGIVLLVAAPVLALTWVSSAYKRLAEAELAEKANEPGKFSAFCSYEWTSTPNNMNLHRNVFFRDCSKVPLMPFSSLDSTHPVDLWNWMDSQRKAGNELLAISHNANLSDGRMYPRVDPGRRATRLRPLAGCNERLIEIKQLKVTSETHPFLSPTRFAARDLSILWAIRGPLPDIVGSYARQR